MVNHPTSFASGRPTYGRRSAGSAPGRSQCRSFARMRIPALKWPVPDMAPQTWKGEAPMPRLYPTLYDGPDSITTAPSRATACGLLDRRSLAVRELIDIQWYPALSNKWNRIALNKGGFKRCDARRPGLVAQQSIDTFDHEALLPAPYAGLELARRRHDANSAQALIRQQNDPCMPDMLLRRTPRRDNRLKPSFVRGRDLDADTSAHRPTSHVPPSQGIPNRTLLPRSIH